MIAPCFFHTLGAQSFDVAVTGGAGSVNAAQAAFVEQCKAQFQASSIPKSTIFTPVHEPFAFPHLNAYVVKTVYVWHPEAAYVSGSTSTASQTRSTFRRCPNCGTMSLKLKGWSPPR